MAAIFGLRPWPEAALEGALAMTLWTHIKTLILPNIAVAITACLAAVLAWPQVTLVVNFLLAAGIGLLLFVLARSMKRLREQTMLGAGDIKLIAALTPMAGSGHSPRSGTR